MSDNPLGYPARVWRLFREMPGAGTLDPAPGVQVVEAASRAQGLRIRLSVRMAGGQVDEARFQALGCPYTIAVGAWLAQWLIGRRSAELDPGPVPVLRTELEIPEDRAHCWVMAQDLLRALKTEIRP